MERTTSEKSITLGFHASHEQWSPSVLLSHTRLAEASGFDGAMCSDHFHPWTATAGASGYAWSWLAAAMEATSLTFGTVCAPGQRYHPAIIAQAAATLSEMYPHRLWIAFGSGEALNELITGEPWPAKELRQQRLLESVQVIRRLWSGEQVSIDSSIRVRNARLYTVPVSAPRIFAAALSAETAAWSAQWAEGLITVARSPTKLRPIIEAFRNNGGIGKPIYLQAALSYAATEDEAYKAALARWRFSTLTAEQTQDIASPEEFDHTVTSTPEDKIRESVRISASLEQHLAWLQDDIDLGVDGIFLHQVAPDVPGFIRDFTRAILPTLRQRVL